MNYKMSRYIKRLAVLFIGFVVFTSILFFVFIAPYRVPPILMYHSISRAEEKNNILSLAKDVFKKQLQYLSKHNYNIISLKELARRIKEGVDIPNNCIVLTFDDGFRDFHTQAYPILKEHKFNATIFVVVRSLGEREDRLTWAEVRQLAKNNLIDIGSHTLSHPILPLLTHPEARKEIFLSKQILEKRLKEPIVTFAYPYGAVDGSSKDEVKQAGFKAAVGTAYQRGQFKDNDLYVLKRVFVSKISKCPFMFKFMLSGYYVPTRELILRVLNIKVPRALYSAKHR